MLYLYLNFQPLHGECYWTFHCLSFIPFSLEKCTLLVFLLYDWNRKRTLFSVLSVFFTDLLNFYLMGQTAFSLPGILWVPPYVHMTDSIGLMALQPHWNNKSRKNSNFSTGTIYYHPVATLLKRTLFWIFQQYFFEGIRNTSETHEPTACARINTFCDMVTHFDYQKKNQWIKLLKTLLME